MVAAFFTVFESFAEGDILQPPMNIPFVWDKVIKRYNGNDALKSFHASGNWHTEIVDNLVLLSGKANEKPAILISKDLLSEKPKSLKIDYWVNEESSNYGFFYGKNGIVVKGNTLVDATFNIDGSILNLGTQKKTAKLNYGSSTNTVVINTGYDSITERDVCLIYINGKGIAMPNLEADSPFGIYIDPHSSITIGNIRWGRGSK